MAQLLQSFKDSNISWENIEIVVAENGENSVLSEMISSWTPILPLVHFFPGVYLLTSEENVFRAWDQCNGEFTWILGDDDPGNFAVLQQLLKILEEGNHNIIKFNSNFIGELGEKYRYQTTPVFGISHTLGFNEFIRRVGMWHTAAGYSTWIFRTSLLDSKSANAWISNFENPIYAHVTYFISMLHDEELFFINQNLVNYRISGYINGDDVWARYAALTKKQYYFPWTLGFIRQLKLLTTNGALSIDVIREMLGDNTFSRRFFEFDSIITLSIRQCILGLEEERERFTLDEWKELISFLSQVSPMDVDIWSQLKSAAVVSWTGTRKQRKKTKRVVTKMLSNRNQYLNSDPFQRNYIMSSGTFDIYSFNDYFVGIAAGADISLGDVCVLDFENIPNNYRFGRSLTTVIDNLQKNDQSWSPRTIPNNSVPRYWFEKLTYVNKIVRVFTTHEKRIMIRKVLYSRRNS